MEQAFATIAKNALAREAAQAPVFVPDTLTIKPDQGNTKKAGCC